MEERRHLERRQQQRRTLHQSEVSSALRPNRLMEMAVNRGLAAIYLKGLSSGIELMRRAGVPQEVISRVLRDPKQRRSTDWRH